MKKLQVVIGGTSGMGLATAKNLGKYGPVFVGGRNEARIENAIKELKDAGVEAYGHPCDVSDLSSVQEFAKAAEKIAPIGNVVNAAGVDFDQATVEQIVKINMRGTINVNNMFLPLINDGTMVNFSSITGYFYTPTPEERDVWNEPDNENFSEKCIEMIKKQENQQPQLGECYPAYCASKSFVMHYTRANAARFGERDSRIISIAPGSFNTPMLACQTENLERIAAGTACKRVGEPEEMASLIYLLLDPKLKYLTGTDIIMDGGKHAMGVTKQL